MVNKEIKFEIVEHLGIWDEGAKGWQGEINRVSWNGADPKIDIRRWNEDHTKMSRGLTLSDGEAGMVAEILYRR